MDYLQIHKEAQRRVREYQNSVSRFLEILERIEEKKVYKQLGYPTLWSYCILCLKLSESETQRFTSVMRKSLAFPELKLAVHSGELSLPKAARIAPLLTQGNKTEWISKAKQLTTRQLEKEIVQERPSQQVRERIIPRAFNLNELRVGLRDETVGYLERVKDLVSQRLRKSTGNEEAISLALREYIERHDPVKRAERAKEREIAKSVEYVKESELARSVEYVKEDKLAKSVERIKEGKPAKSSLPQSKNEESRPSALKVAHQISLRDQGQCTAILPNGMRCESRRHLDMHHIIHRSKGGLDTLENLTTLCHSHHRMQHEEQNGLLF